MPEATRPYNRGEYVLLAVSDTGPGIDQSIINQIFEPFFSTKGEQGTGLGLATVYGIVKQHNGNIWVYSEPGQGTTFKVYLPVIKGASSSIEPEKKPVVITELRGNEAILIVEDNDMVRHLAFEILKPLGYSILTAKNATEALTISASSIQPVDLVLTDVIMPDMDGKTMFNQLTNYFPKAEVLYMSGYTNEVIAHHGGVGSGCAIYSKTVHCPIVEQKSAGSPGIAETSQWIIIVDPCRIDILHEPPVIPVIMAYKLF